MAFVVGKAVGLVNGNASADYIQLYQGNASLLAESLEVIQQTASVILCRAGAAPQGRGQRTRRCTACGGGGMKTILAILQKAGGWRPSLYLKIENPPSYGARHRGDRTNPGRVDFQRFSVAHYGEQNGDAMRDPEMCFELGFAGGAHLDPFYWRNDYVVGEQWSRNILRRPLLFLLQLHGSMSSLPRRGTTTCECRASPKSSRTSASSASPLPWSGTRSDPCRSATFTLNRSKGAHSYGHPSHHANASTAKSLFPCSWNRPPIPANTSKNMTSRKWRRPSASPAFFKPSLSVPERNGFEIVFGARRYRAAQMAGKETIPALSRDDRRRGAGGATYRKPSAPRCHPMEEAQGFKRLLLLTEPNYTVEQIAAKVGKTPAYITTRLKLTELRDEVAAAFYQDQSA